MGLPRRPRRPRSLLRRRARRLHRRSRKRRPSTSLPRRTRCSNSSNRLRGTISSGVDNYRGGRLEAARSDFDMAVDLMLTSGMDVKNDPQLSDEFEHLLNAINSLEMSALKAGHGIQCADRGRAAGCRRRGDLPAQCGAHGEGHGRAEDDAVGLSAGGQRLCGGVHQLLHELADGPRASPPLAGTRGQVQGDDLEGPERRGRTAGPDLSGGGGVGLPAAGAECAFGRRRHVAVHAVSQVRTVLPAMAGSTSASIRRNPRWLMRST